MTATAALIHDLRARAGYDGTWSVAQDELSDRYDPVDLYRAVYAAGQVSVDRYGPENTGELLALLEQLTGRDYGPEFREAGLFLSHDDRLDLTERFVRLVRCAVVLHLPEPETFRAMLREFRRYDRARLVYLSTFFDTETLVRQCADEYLEVRDAAALRFTVESYLRQLLQRHIVDFEDLAPALLEILRTVARHEGMLPGSRGGAGFDRDADAADDHGNGRADAQRPHRAESRAQALQVLGLGSEPARAEIRDRYRSLMRRYHPDVNPNGLERAKLINNAYAVLINASAADF